MLSLSLVTPAKKLVTDVEVDEVFVPSVRGEIEILDGHAPLMSTLETGILRFKKTGETTVHSFAISWGYLEVSGNRVTVLAETAEASTEIDIARAQEAKTNAEKELGKADAEQRDFAKYQLKLERAITRIQVADKNTTH